MKEEQIMNEARLIGLPTHDLASAPEGSKAILENSLAQTGAIPNMYGNMANSVGLLTSYRFGYEVFRNESGFSPTEQELIFITLSRFHECTYCVAVHSAIAKSNKVPVEITDAIRNNTPLEDSKLTALRHLTEEMVETRGRPSADSLKNFLAAGYSEVQVLEIILAIAMKTMSNYSNHFFDTALDTRFASFEWKL